MRPRAKIKPKAKIKKAKYFVYILECVDGTLYTGITNNLEKRMLAHNSKGVGAKYTRSRRPVVLKYSESLGSKSGALKKEIEIKKLTRAQKLLLIKNMYSSRS